MDEVKKELPTYSVGEERFNCISHLLGAIFGMFLLGYFNYLEVSKGFTPLEYISLLVYSLSMIVLYLTSFIYHFLRKDSPLKHIFRLLDHNTIYFLIAGTYFPVTVFALSRPSMIIAMSVEVICLIVGIILNHLSFTNKWTKIITTIIYLVMGWIAIFFPDTYKIFPLSSFLFVLSGGVMYSIGVIFYVLGKKKKWFHSYFHLFVLFGTIIQFVGIYLLIK